MQTQSRSRIRQSPSSQAQTSRTKPIEPTQCQPNKSPCTRARSPTPRKKLPAAYRQAMSTQGCTLLQAACSSQVQAPQRDGHHRHKMQHSANNAKHPQAGRAKNRTGHSTGSFYRKRVSCNATTPPVHLSRQTKVYMLPLSIRLRVLRKLWRKTRRDMHVPVRAVCHVRRHNPPRRHHHVLNVQFRRLLQKMRNAHHVHTMQRRNINSRVVLPSASTSRKNLDIKCTSTPLTFTKLQDSVDDRPSRYTRTAGNY
jgi:hypothetical protein